MKESIKLFIAMILFLFGMIISPVFSPNGVQSIQMTISIILTGGGFLYICWLLYNDNFDSDDNYNIKNTNIVCIITSLLGLVGQIILRCFYGVKGCSIFSYFLFDFEWNTTTAIIIYITILLSSFAPASIFLWSMTSVDTSQHFFEKTTYSDDIEINREIVNFSVERHMIFLFALISALLGIFSTSLFLSFILLGININLLIPNKRIGKITLITSIIASILSFIFTFNTIDYTFQNIIVVMDIIPILFLGLTMLIIHLNEKYLIGGIAAYSIAIIGFIIICGASFGLSLVLSNIKFVISDIFDEILIVFAIALVIVLIICLIISNKEKNNVLDRKTNIALSIFTYPLIFLVLSSSIGTTNLFEGFKQYTNKVEYELTGEYITYDNINYAESDLGLIAIELINKDVEAATLKNFGNKTIYSVSSGFLSNNKKIKNLTVSNGKYFEKNCIINCPNLKTINLSYEAESIPCCEKDAFVLSKETKFIIKNLNNINNYIKALSPYTKLFKFESDVYINYSAEIDVACFSPKYIDSPSISMEIVGNVFGLKKINYSKRSSEIVSNVEKVFSEDDNIFQNGKLRNSSFKIKFSYSGSVCLKVWFLTNCDNFGGSGKVTTDKFPYFNSIYCKNELNSYIEFSVYLTYNEN